MTTTVEPPDQPEPDREPLTPAQRYASFKFGVMFFGGNIADEDEIRAAYERETGHPAPQEA